MVVFLTYTAIQQVTYRFRCDIQISGWPLTSENNMHSSHIRARTHLGMSVNARVHRDVWLHGLRLRGSVVTSSDPTPGGPWFASSIDTRVSVYFGKVLYTHYISQHRNKIIIATWIDSDWISIHDSPSLRLARIAVCSPVSSDGIRANWCNNGWYIQ